MSNLLSTSRILLLAVSLLVSCDDDEGGSGTRLPTAAELMRDAADTTIVPDVERFATEAQSLLAESETFCAQTDADALAQLQSRWRTLSEAWNAIAAYNLGPLDDDIIVPKILFIESMRQRGTDYTQTVRESIVRRIEGTDTIDVDSVSSQTFDEIGMLALEVLLFEDSREGNSSVPADIVDDYQSQPRKCAYLMGIAGLLADDAAEVERGWTTEFADTGEAFKDTMASPKLPDGTEPIVALLIALQQHLDYLMTRKLEGILDARLSEHFYPNVVAALDAMQEVLQQPREDSFGVLEWMEATNSAEEVELVLANFAAARAAATAEDREALTAAIGRLDGNLKREIPDALGLDLGLTFTDGD